MAGQAQLVGQAAEVGGRGVALVAAFFVVPLGVDRVQRARREHRALAGDVGHPAGDRPEGDHGEQDQACLT